MGPGAPRQANLSGLAGSASRARRPDGYVISGDCCCRAGGSEHARGPLEPSC